MSRGLTTLLLVGLCGCAGYQLGPSNGTAAGSKSIRVDLFQNNTFEPRLSEPVATALRRELQRDGTFRLATRGLADVVVEGNITEYDRGALSFDPRDVVTARDFNVSLRADVKAVEISTGRVLFEGEVYGRTVVRVNADLASAERQAVPLLAEDLARNLTSRLVDGTW